VLIAQVLVDGGHGGELPEKLRHLHHSEHLVVMMLLIEPTGKRLGLAYFNHQSL